MEQVVEKWYEVQLGIAVSLYPRFKPMVRNKGLARRIEKGEIEKEWGKKANNKGNPF